MEQLRCVCRVSGTGVGRGTWGSSGAQEEGGFVEVGFISKSIVCHGRVYLYCWCRPFYFV